MPFGHLCTGPNAEKVAEHEDKAQYQNMMAKFYTLSASKQRVFIAMFNQLVEDAKQEMQL